MTHRIRTLLGLMLPLLALFAGAGQLAAATSTTITTEQSYPVWCVGITGTAFTADFTASTTTFTSTTEYVLVFGPSGASIRSLAGAVIVSAPYQPTTTILSPTEVLFSYENSSFTGISMTVYGGSATGGGPNGVTTCILQNLSNGSSASFDLKTGSSYPAGLPVITSAATATGAVGTPFSYQITATGSPTSYGTSQLPAGLTLNATTGLISGTPTASATTSVVTYAINGTGGGTLTIILTISGATGSPVISSATTASATVGTAFSYQITASGSPTSYGATGLPAGLTVSTATGAITGTPTTAGTATVTLSAANGTGTGTTTLTVTIAPMPGAPVITSALAASGAVNAPFSYQITASNSPTSYLVTGFPSGLVVDSGTGVISGTPIAAAVSTLTISATNAAGTGSATLILTIAAAGSPVITSALAATATEGTPFSYQIVATGSPTSYAATGLPPAWSYDPVHGMVSGTPTTSGVISIVLIATNASGSGTATLVVTVAASGGAANAPAASGGGGGGGCGLGSSAALLSLLTAFGVLRSLMQLRRPDER